MAQALSDDLRRRAVTAVQEEGLSRRGAAAREDIHSAGAERRHSGEWKPLPSSCMGTLASPTEFSAVPVRFPGFPDRDRTSQRIRRSSQTGR